MASSPQGIKRSNAGIYTDSTQVKHARSEPKRFNPYRPLFIELWIKIFSHILPEDIRPVSSVCWEFSRLRVPCFYEHLRDKKELASSDIQKAHPPLTQLLIYNDARFDKSFENERNEIQSLWTDHSIVKIFPFIIFHCHSLEVLDLRDNRYSLATFLGNLDDYKGEVLTLDASQCLEYDRCSTIDPVVDPMLLAFDMHYPILKRLITVRVLKVTWYRDMEDTIWDTCAQVFPNLETLVLEKSESKSSATVSEVKSITCRFPNLKACSLIKIAIVVLSRKGSSFRLHLEQ